MRAAVLSLLLALPLFAQFGGYYRFEPVAPTDRSFVVLQVRQIWRDGCVPHNERVTRKGNAITVSYETPRNTACPAALLAWNADAPLGVLAAGVYTVTVQVDDVDGLRTLTTLTLVVTEGSPSLRIAPQMASTAGGTEITIANVCAAATLIVDGATVPSRLENCTLKATLPAHAPGPVDVQVVTAAGTFEAVNGVRFVDPTATPDASLYERVLIPVLFDGPGAFGSEWETDVIMTNVSTSPWLSLSAVSRPLPDVAAGGTVSLSKVFGNRPAGLVLFVPRTVDVRFGSHIRDISRDATQWGTEMPVVRENDARGMIVLPDVPFDARYRLQLRIYSLDGEATTVSVSAPPASMRQVTLAGPCLTRDCNSSEPAYASVDLRQLLPGLMGKREIVISQNGLQSARLWAFVTVTNNETQHVTVISPQ